MKPSAVYREAARLMERRSNLYFCCHALGEVSADETLCLSMKRMYAPRSRLPAWMSINGLCIQDERPIRILALCFMAAIAEDEEKHRAR